MVTKFTPGLWHAVGGQVKIDDDNVPDICTCEPAAMEQDHLYPRSDEEIAANARLIARAPLMYTTLTAIKLALEMGISPADILAPDSEIRMAIVADVDVMEDRS